MEDGELLGEGSIVRESWESLGLAASVSARVVPRRAGDTDSHCELFAVSGGGLQALLENEHYGERLRRVIEAAVDTNPSTRASACVPSSPTPDASS